MKQKGLAAYDERCRLVFEAGGLYWNNPEPNEYLKNVLKKLLPNSKCVEFGCGEGYQAYYMASQGHQVTGIDLAPSAIEKAKSDTPAGLDPHFIVGDITEPDSLDLEPESFDLAVNIGTLHMMAEEVSDFYKRPMLVPHSGRFVDALLGKVRSKRLKSLKRPVGLVNQFIDSTDALEWTGFCQQVTSLFREKPI